jgi:predicted TPR repeat methyltransferase
MRTAADFNDFYRVNDPWNLTRARFRNRIFRKLLPGIIRDRNILELGCGEGHLTKEVFDGARFVLGIDISNVAIERAKARRLPNAQFECSDFLGADFGGHDIITAIECIYYLTPDEKEQFFAKVAREHAGKLLLLSAPIIGENQFRRYFTHAELIATFERHGMNVESFHNLNIYRRGIIEIALEAAVRAVPPLLNLVPMRFIYQRLYMIRIM